MGSGVYVKLLAINCLPYCGTLCQNTAENMMLLLLGLGQGHPNKNIMEGGGGGGVIGSNKIQTILKRKSWFWIRKNCRFQLVEKITKRDKKSRLNRKNIWFTTATVY